MGIFKKRLNQRQKLLAVQLAREYYEVSGGNKVEFDRLLREDSRVKAIDPMLVILLIKVAYMVFEYFRNRPARGEADVVETDAEIYTNSLRYEE